MSSRRKSHPLRPAWSLLLILVVILAVVLPVGAQPPVTPASGRTLPLKLEPVVAEDGALPSFSHVPAKERAEATKVYAVQMADQPLAMTWLAAQSGGVASQATMQAAYADLVSKQDALSAQVVALGGEVLASYQKTYNGLAVSIATSKVRDLLALPGVINISPLPDFQINLDETVPWIGASEVQAMGYTGEGIRVAVIDSGIDYTHAHLGGCGTQECTDKALAEASQPADPALYPTAKVIGGYDFVGSNWDGETFPWLQPDPNPMDDQAGGIDGHGTHVADIIGGVATADLGPGVAPGAELYALKVCSSVNTSCSGVAMLQAIDWMADPNGDFFFDDRADVANLSIGSVYGQPGDATDHALAAYAALGGVYVGSAGNSGDLPYVTGSPATTRAGISVAQTTVPSAVKNLMRRNAPEPQALFNAVFQPWSAYPTGNVTGDVVYGNGDGSNLDGCAPFTADLTGMVSLIDRGGCTFTSKVLNAEDAGAIMAIIVQNSPADPFEGSWGGEGFPTIPGFMISRSDGSPLKVEGANVTFDPTDPALSIPLPDTIVGSSSRGPRFDLSYLKPDIGAPGASISASSGDQSYVAFGGTSGAAPMVAGSAALLLDAAGGSGSLAPVVVKAKLMNNAMTNVWQDQPGGTLAPISRQGAGRVDVEAAVEADTIAWVPADHDVALSFGFETVAGEYMDNKTVEVINTSAESKTYAITAGFRYASDDGAGVDITVSTDTLTVPAGGSGNFGVHMHIMDPLALHDWPFYGGSTFASGAALTDVEYDGFVTLTADDGEVINLPWHFLPRVAADVQLGDLAPVSDSMVDVPLTNASVVTGTVEVYPLVDSSPQIYVAPTEFDIAPADLRYVGVDAYSWAEGENLLLFPINTWNSRSHPINIEFDVYIDIDQDGSDDYVAYNSLLNGSTDPRAVSVLCELATLDCGAQFFLDSTLNSDTMVIPVIVPDNDMAFNFQVYAFDAYYTGDLWDWSPANALAGGYNIFNAMKPAFVVDEYALDVAGLGTATSQITGLLNRSPSQIGMLYRFVNGPLGAETAAVMLPTPPQEPVTVQVPLMADTFVNGGNVNANYNKDAILITRNTGVDNALFQFQNVVPAGVEITSATLTVNVVLESGTLGKELFALNVEDFDPATVQFSDLLKYTNPGPGAPVAFGPVNVDVTNQVAAWSGDYGYLALGTSGPLGRVSLQSLESYPAGTQAVLSVTYVPNP